MRGLVKSLLEGKHSRPITRPTDQYVRSQVNGIGLEMFLLETETNASLPLKPRQCM